MSTPDSVDESAFNTLCGLLASTLAPPREQRRPFVLFLGSALNASLLDDLELRVLTSDGTSDAEVLALDRDSRAARFAAVWQQRDVDGCRTWYRASEQCIHHGGAGSAGRGSGAVEAQFAAALRRDEGWSQLARLIAKGVFEVVLTTDVGASLEDVLAARHPPRSDVQVWARNGVDPRQAQPASTRSWPWIKILKLHGDLAVNPRDLPSAERHPWHDLLTELFSGRVLMLGLDPIRDRDVVAALDERRDGELFYVAPQRPTFAPDVGRRLAARGMSSFITGPLAQFETFVARLAERLVGERVGDYGLTDVVAVRAQRGASVSEQEIHSWSHTGRPLVELLPEVSAPARSDLVELTRRATVYLRYDDRLRCVSFRVAGGMTYDSTSRPLDLDVDELNEMMRILGTDVLLYHQRDVKYPGHIGDWRSRAKREGLSLYRALFQGHPELMENLGRARLAVGDRLEDLLLACEGPATHLGLPYELLQATSNAAPWVASSALYRRLSDVNVSRPSVADLLTRLRRDRRPLRVLLVVPERGVDQDADDEARRLNACFKAQRKPSVVVTELAGPQASSLGIREALRGEHHVLHYYGHGVHARDGESSGLLLNRSPQDVLCTYHLSEAVRTSSVTFAFLNTCVGAMTAPATVLQRHDHLGTLEALATAGVPAVLGYRWWARTSSAHRFAEEFYRALFVTESAPLATRRARRALYDANPNDETWLSPVLISQLD